MEVSHLSQVSFTKHWCNSLVILDLVWKVQKLVFAKAIDNGLAAHLFVIVSVFFFAKLPEIILTYNFHSHISLTTMFSNNFALQESAVAIRVIYQMAQYREQVISLKTS